MNCPECQNPMTIDQNKSRGMGNQTFQDCPRCGVLCLVSGEKNVTQVWTREEESEEKGDFENAIRTIH